MLKLIIFLVITFLIAYFVFNLFMSKREHGSAKFILPIMLSLLIVVMIFFILPRLGINPIALFQNFVSKIIPFISMLRGIVG